jgi:hypothetical protein
VQSKSLSPSARGYAFVINGQLFSSSAFYSNQITQQLNFSTGNLTSVNDVLNIPGSLYIDDAFYDPTLNALYVHNESNGDFYVAYNASQQFGAFSPTPAPSTFVMLSGLLMMVGTVCTTRRLKRITTAA